MPAQPLKTLTSNRLVMIFLVEFICSPDNVLKSELDSRVHAQEFAINGPDELNLIKSFGYGFLSDKGRQNPTLFVGF
jgi:hypothetical protein